MATAVDLPAVDNLAAIQAVFEQRVECPARIGHPARCAPAAAHPSFAQDRARDQLCMQLGHAAELEVARIAIVNVARILPRTVEVKLPSLWCGDQPHFGSGGLLGASTAFDWWLRRWAGARARAHVLGQQLSVFAQAVAGALDLDDRRMV